jgi:hypothetical protein
MATNIPKAKAPQPDESVLRWLLAACFPGMMTVEIGEGEGQASRWITLHGLGVLDWYYGRD